METPVATFHIDMVRHKCRIARAVGFAKSFRLYFYDDRIGFNSKRGDPIYVRYDELACQGVGIARGQVRRIDLVTAFGHKIVLRNYCDMDRLHALVQNLIGSR